MAVIKKQKHLITLEGINALKTELKFLKEEKRVEIAEKLKEAISFGDLSENAEYADARDQQASLELRIQEIEDILGNYDLIEEEKHGGRIEIGDTVTLEDILGADMQVVKYKIVGSMEADIFQDRISNESPIGSQLIGKTQGEVITGMAPLGKFQYKILDF